MGTVMAVNHSSVWPGLVTSLPTEKGNRADSVSGSAKRSYDLVSASDSSQAGKDFLEGEAVIIGIEGAASIFDNDEGKTQASALAGGGFDAKISGNTGKDDGVDGTLAERLF